MDEEQIVMTEKCKQKGRRIASKIETKQERTLMVVLWGERMGIARGRKMVLWMMVLSTMVLQRVCSLAFCLGWRSAVVMATM